MELGGKKSLSQMKISITTLIDKSLFETHGAKNEKEFRWNVKGISVAERSIFSQNRKKSILRYMLLSKFWFYTQGSFSLVIR